MIQKKVLGEYSCLQSKNNTFTEIAKAAFKAFNKDLRIDFLPDKNDIPDKGFKIDNELYDLIEYFPKISIDEGVGDLIELASEKGRKQNKSIKLGICGEHGGDPKSIHFCSNAGLNYVSCSPYRVPVARLAAAQAQLKK